MSEGGASDIGQEGSVTVSSNRRRFRFLSHREDGLLQPLFELVQSDDLQIRSLRQEHFDDNCNDGGGPGRAQTRLHHNFQGRFGGIRRQD